MGLKLANKTSFKKGHKKSITAHKFPIGHKINNGKASWNKGTVGLYKHSEETRRKMSASLKGKVGWNKGKKFSAEVRKKMSESRKGEKHHNWQGGITPQNRKIRASFEYKLWREAVFKRDNWTCVWCGVQKVYLNADHIKPFAFYPELRFALDNGRTLCVPCHKTTETYLNNKKP